MNIKIYIIFSCLFLGLIAKPTIIIASEKLDSINPFFFIKKERISGVIFKGHHEREQLLTDFTKFNEKLFTTSAQFRLGRRFWNLLDYKQERFDFTFETGPVFGTGDRIDSSNVAYLSADRNIAGLRNNLVVSYNRRLYYDYRNYTLVEVNAWGRYDLFRQNTSGTLRDSNLIYSNYADTDYNNKFRYGIKAKAAWGLGRLNPMNHYMVSEFLLNKYYSRRTFSEEEVIKLAQEIGKIKHDRNLNEKRSTEEEISQLNNFLKSELMLKKLENSENDWQRGEFMPRFDGQRIELGPFFNYYNREPDLVYGAYINMDLMKYIDFRWNRNIAINFGYNRYKKGNWVRDWLMLETDLGWSFYPNLKTQINFGLKYLPGMVVNEFTDLEPISHNVIPYLEYYTQVNSKARVNLAFAWIITDGEQFLQSGPELSLTIYNSRY